MNRRPNQENHPRLATETPGTCGPGQPIALAVVAVVSLCAFGAAGWSLGRMRAAGPVALAVDEPETRAEPKGIAGQGGLSGAVRAMSWCLGPRRWRRRALLKTPPRDLAAVVGSRSVDVLRRSISEGVAGTPMTGYGQLLSTRELDSLLEFVRSLAARDRFLRRRIV